MIIDRHHQLTGLSPAMQHDDGLLMLLIVMVMDRMTQDIHF
jgi:hypothetical protein